MFQFPKEGKRNMVLILIFLNNSRVNLDFRYRVYCSRDGKVRMRRLITIADFLPFPMVVQLSSAYEADA